MPGKLGDLVATVPLLQELRRVYGGAAIDFVTSPYSAAAIELIIEACPGLLGEVAIMDSYRPTATEPGLQPFFMPVPREWYRDGHRDVFHLGYRRHPNAREDLTACLAATYGLKPRIGPWLDCPKRAGSAAGALVAHAPVTDVPGAGAALRELLDRVRGREVILVGTVREFVAYQELQLDRMPGVRPKEMESLIDVWRLACEGAAGFTGVASAPAMVAAASGLPCTWVLQAGGTKTCVPKGCSVRVFGEIPR